ncbi:MAG: hypothetical protein H6713_41670 [Myxococcales bacterium]|nr:hypothetical protein [Myxococcales bacterium]MCB9756473.1 hypothetical protein [Myxococcales bacterium]
MAKKATKNDKDSSPDDWATNGFERSHDQSGTAEDVEDFLKKEGFLDDEEPRQSRRGAKKQAKSTAKKKSKKSRSRKATSQKRGRSTTPKAPTMRKKGRRPFKGRHFRLPLETDDQLQFLTRHYECYMLDVVKLAIHNEWMRVTRERRRSVQDEGTDHDESEADDASA